MVGFQFPPPSFFVSPVIGGVQLFEHKGVLSNCTPALQQKRRPPLPEGRDGLTRSLMHCSRPSQFVLPLGISLAMGLKKEGRNIWLVATLGPFGPGVKREARPSNATGRRSSETSLVDPRG